jgi:hypothetical protein
VTRGSDVNNRVFGGIALVAPGPVRPIIAARGARHGTAIIQGGKLGRWYDIKTLWFSAASYQGPVLIRGQRLDGPGVLRFGRGTPESRYLVDQGTTLTHVRGVMRSWPGGTYVTSPGCYGFQVDGLHFSYHLFLNIQLPAH